MTLSDEQAHSKDLFPDDALLTRAILLFIACLTLSLTCIYLLRQPGSAAFTWYANGFAIAMVALAPQSQRLALIGSAFVAILLANLLFGDTPFQSIQLALSNTATITAGSYSLVYASRHASPFLSMPSFFLFIGLTVTLSPLLGAIAGGFTLHQALDIPFQNLALAWYFGDVIGILAITPVTYVLLKRPIELPSSFSKVKTMSLICGITLLSGYLLSHMTYPFIAIAFALTFACAILDRLSAFITAFLVSFVLDILLISPSTNLTLTDVAVNPGNLLPPIAGAMLIGILLAVKSAKLRQIQKMSDEKAALFSGAMNTSVIGMVIMSPEGNMIKANRSFLAFVGLSDEALQKKNFYQLIFHSDKHNLNEQCQKLIDEETDNFQLALRFLTKNKHVVWAKIGVSAVKDRWTEDVIHFVYQIQNIDKERRIDAERSIWAQKFEFALGINRIAVYEMECHTKYMHLSENAYQSIGIHAHNVKRLYEWMALIHPEDLREYQHSVSRIGLEPVAMEYRLLDDEQTYRWIRDCSQPIEQAPHNTTKIVIGTITDISHEHNASNDNKSLDRLALALKSAQFGVWEYDPYNDVLFWNSEMYTMFGMQIGEFIDKRMWRNLLHPHDRRQFDSMFTLANNESHYQTHVRRMLDGEDGLHHSIMVKITNDGVQSHLVGVCALTPNPSAPQRQATAQTQLASAIHAVSEGIIVLDTHLNIQVINQSARDITHCTAESIGKSIDACFTLFDDDTLLTFEYLLIREPSDDFLQGKAFWLQTNQGLDVQVALSVKPALSEGGTLDGWILTLQHTAKASWMDRSDNDLRLDRVTGLPNRRDFEHVLQHHIDTLAHKQGEHTLAVVELQGLGALTDSLGRPARDQVIKSAALVLKVSAHKTGYLARISDDRFAILLQHCSPSHAIEVAKEITIKLNQIKYTHNTEAFSIESAIGLAAADSIDILPLQLLYHAEVALALAVEGDTPKVSLFDESTLKKSMQLSRDNLLQQIDTAIDQNSFTLLCMPIVPRRNGLSTWHELLIRMITEEGQLLLPNQFFTAAEQTGRLINIERWVFTEVLENQAQALHSANLSVAINISSEAFYNSAFIEHCTALIKQSVLPASNLCIEVKEGTLLIDLIKAREIISAFRALGCEIAIDNFGSELTSFTHLKTLNITMLKIDGSIISLMRSSRVEKRIVESIKQIGDTLNIKTAAQKVNNEDDYQQVQAAGLDYTQGYVFGEPLPLSRVISSAKAGISNRLMFPKSAS
ncbi:EAL domain-containing protein [Enterovibrio sp. 27052020O]|uniref:EAL domain-containing protein n=1 Tax=Enterovibrio sp. 27052020O TaxID=3241166 RepID=UPI003890029A